MSRRTLPRTSRRRAAAAVVRSWACPGDVALSRGHHVFGEALCREVLSSRVTATERAVPPYRGSQSTVRIQRRPPIELVCGLGAVEFEEPRLVRTLPARFRTVPASLAPLGDHGVNHIAHGELTVRRGTEVPRPVESVAVLQHPACEPQVAREGFEYMLPGSDGIRVADND